MKRVILFCVALILASYLVAVAVYAPRFAKPPICKKVQVTFSGDARAAVVLGEKEVLAMMNGIDSLPIGKPVNSYNTYRVERKLAQRSALIDHCNIYFAPNGKMNVQIRRRVPLFALLANDNKMYYVTRKREAIAIDSGNNKQVLPVPILYGNVSVDDAKSKLFDNIKTVSNDAMWSTLFTDFYVDKDHNLVASGPLVSCRVAFGNNPALFNEQLKHLKLFINHAIPKFGWPAFESLSLIIPNQVIATCSQRYMHEHNMLQQNEAHTN